jgi:hypothetical protein
MDRLVELLVEIKTPLALAGGGLALALAIFQQVLKRRNSAGAVTLVLLRYAFVLGLAALILGFTGYALPLFLPDFASISGVVLDERGTLVDQAIVSIAGMPEINDQTGTNGNFRITIPAPKRQSSYTVFARNGEMIGSAAVNDHFDNVLIRIARIEPDANARRAAANAEAERQATADAEAQRRAAADAETRRQLSVDTEAKRQAADAETRKQAEASAEARRQAEANAEARRQAEADAEARRQAEVNAEARRQAEADAEARRQAEANAEARRQAEADAEARRQAAGARINLDYPDLSGCGLALDIKIGDKHFHPSGNPAQLRGVPLGDQDYEVSGRVTCQASWCFAYGSGSIHVDQGSTYNIGWLNNQPGRCEVTIAE